MEYTLATCPIFWDHLRERADGLDLRTVKVRGAPRGSWRRLKIHVVELEGEANTFGDQDKGAVVEFFAGVTEAPEKKAERERAILQAWATMVRLALEAPSYGYGPGFESINPTRRAVSVWIAKIAADKEARWHPEIEAAAKSAGITALGEKTVRAALTETFFPKHGPRPHFDFEPDEVFEDEPVRLVTSEDKGHFRLVQNPLAVAARERAEEARMANGQGSD